MKKKVAAIYKSYLKKLKSTYKRNGVLLRRFGCNSKKTILPQWKEAISVSVLVAILATTFWGGSVDAATYTFTQSDWSGGADVVNTAGHTNNQNGWNKFSSSTGLNLSDSVSVSMASTTFTETFATSTYRDLLKTSADWNTNTGVLKMMSEQGVDISSIISSYGIDVPLMVYDSIGNDVYITHSSTYYTQKKFIKYDLDTGTVTNLSNIPISGFGSGDGYATVYEIGIDVERRHIYFAGERSWDDGYDGGIAGALYAYNISSGQMSFRSGLSQALAIDKKTGNVYTGHSGLYRYNPSTQQTTDLTTKLWNITPYATVYSLAYDDFSNSIYIGANNKLYKYSIDTDTLSDISSEQSLSWGAASIGDMGSTPSSNYIWMIGEGGRFAKYNTQTGQFTNLSYLIGTTELFTDMYVSPDGGYVYIATFNGKIYKYDILQSTLSNLTPQISSFWGNRYTYAGEVIKGDFYFTATGRLGKLVSGCGDSCVAVSTTIDNVASNIETASLTKNDIVTSGTASYYLSNNGGNDWAQVTPSVPYTFTTIGSDLRFKIVLTGGASVQDVSINYSYYNSSGSLISSSYDGSDSTNIIGSISWNENPGAVSGVTASLRTSATSDLSASVWTDFTAASAGCSKDEDTGTVTCTSDAIPNLMKDGVGDQWFQYKLTLNTSANLPVVNEIRISYVVNVPPEFNSDFPTPGGTGVSAVQISDSSDPDFGKVKIQYSVRDLDTTLGSLTPGFLTPSFEFNIGGGWVPIQATYLREGDVANKAVDSSVFSTYSAVWSAGEQIPSQSIQAAKIRVTINDNEGANNITQAESADFALDTTAPVLSSFKFDKSIGKINISANDSSNIEYRLSATADLSGSEWTSVNAAEIVSTLDWPGSDRKVYLEVRDAVGNVTSANALVPTEPIYLDIRDVGNNQNSEYREFLSWKVYTTETGAEFAGYEIYRSTDGSNYSKIETITDPAQNYYTDISVSNTNTYNYKLTLLDTDGDRSSFSTIVSDSPDGQGGTDFTSPIISDVLVAETQTGWVKITWSTDEISDSVIEYSKADVADYSLVKSSSSLMTEHSIILSGLTANTDYVFRVKSTDIMNNEGVDNNGGQGYTFTTIGGSEISGVSVRSTTDTTANIVWYTGGAADSHVVYSTDIADLLNGVNTNETGSDGFVEEPFEHSVNLSGLLPKTSYYFFVKSKDAVSGIESIDNNEGEFYEFNTTLDRKDPKITNIQTPIIAPNAASITWVTDELADSVVDYGLSPDEYTESSSIDPTLSIYHVVTLNGLKPQTTYYFRVKSHDAVGNKGSATSTLSTISDLKTVTVTIDGSEGGANKEDTTPPKITDVKVNDITAFGSTISFKTDTESTAFVEFGEKENYGKTVGSSKMQTSHQVKLFGLRGGTEYNYQVKAYDKSGNMAALPNQKFQTKFVTEELDELTKLDNMEHFQDRIESLIESTLPSLVPPVISDVEVTNVTENSAEIAWSTNVKAFGSVALTKSDRYVATESNPYDFEMSSTQEKTRTHKMTVHSLEPGTRYNFQVRSFSIPGVVGKSKDYNLATLASNVKSGAITATNNSITLSWQTADETTSFVEYRNLTTGDVGRYGKEEYTRNHIVTVNNLPGATTFEATYFGNTRDGIRIQGAPLRITTIVDNSAPILNNVSVSSAFVPYRPNQLQTIVSWRTEEPSNSIVQFEEGPGSSDKLSGEAGDKTEYVKEHIVILPGFKPGTVYRMRIISEDMAGNKGVVPTRTIITPVATDSVFEIIVKNFEDVFGFLKNMR